MNFCFRLLCMLALVGSVHAQPGAHPSHEHHAKCGTALLMSIMSGEKIATERELAELSIPCLTRVVKSNSVLSSKNHFRVHYDTFGRDSVSIVDKNSNGVPDFIDSVAFYLEYAWEVEIDQMGFDPPPPDNRGAGPEIDVFICELDTELYGVAIPESDNPTGSNRVSGFLVLDDNYNRGLYTLGIAAVRVTTAHEFHHLVQFSRYRFDYSQGSLYESTATWMEKGVHPNDTDYFQYARPFITAPQDFGFSTQLVQGSGPGANVTGYAHLLYMDYIAKRLGRNVIREIWERFRDQPIGFNAIDEALIPHGINLENSYCEFAQWSYRSGDRAQDSTFFDRAAEYPTMEPALFNNFLGEDVTFSDKLFPLGFGLYEIALPTSNPNIRDSVDFVVTNARTNFGKGGPGIAADAFTLTISRNQRDGYRPIRGESDSLYYKLNSPHSQFCLDVIVGGKPVLSIATRISPQPYLSDGTEQLLFSIDNPGEQVANAHLAIWSTGMTKIAEVSQVGLKALNNQLGVIWNGRDSHGDIVPSGVYIYELVVNDGEPRLGKFVVVRTK